MKVSGTRHSPLLCAWHLPWSKHSPAPPILTVSPSGLELPTGRDLGLICLLPKPPLPRIGPGTEQMLNTNKSMGED